MVDDKKNYCLLSTNETRFRQSTVLSVCLLVLADLSYWAIAIGKRRKI